MRINKYLASCDLGSRRAVEALILDGKVYINGSLCTDLATHINPETDEVKVGRFIVQPTSQKIFLLLNKPKGFVVTKDDEFKRKTIYDLLPDFAKSLHPVGRLDFDSEGLLLLTNDGDMTNKMTHPAYKLEKIYKVTVKGKIDMSDVEKLRNGVEIEHNTPRTKYTTQSAKVFLKSSSDEKSELKIGIAEGKNRQIRKMFQTLGHEVIALKRIQIVKIKLDRLPIGMWRFLKDSEILYLLKLKERK